METKDIIAKIKEVKGNIEKAKSAVHKIDEEIEQVISPLKKKKKRATRKLELLKNEKEALESAFEKRQCEFEVYSQYDIRDLGDVLAGLTSKITGVEHSFEIVLEDMSQCIRNDSVSYKGEMAVITGPIVSYTFEKARIDPEKNTIYHGHGNYMLPGATGKCPDIIRFKKHEKTRGNLYYNLENDTLCTWATLHHIKDYGNREIPGFIKDFMLYASNYRLQNNMVDITKEQLQELSDTFIKENYQKYCKKYKSHKKY